MSVAEEVESFSHDQVPATRVDGWGDSWVMTSENWDALKNRFFLLNLDEMSAQELSVPGKGRIVSIATGENHRKLAVLRSPKMISLMYWDNSEWKPVAIPEQFSKNSADSLRFVAEGEHCVFLAGDDIGYRMQGDWTHLSVSWEEIGLPPPTTREAFALSGNRLYLGYDRGEQGGAVVSFDLRTRQWEGMPKKGSPSSRTPVHGFRRDPQGDLWVVEGLAHRNVRRRGIRKLEGGVWTAVASSEGTRVFESNSLVSKWVDGPSMGWNHSGTDFLDMAFDGSGREHVLSATLGIYRRESQGWARRTPSWPHFSYKTANSPSVVSGGPTSLVIVDEHTAILAAWATGTLIWNFDSNRVKRISIAK